MSGYFDGLTGIRGLLAMWVVVGHSLGASGYRYADMHWSVAWLIRPHIPVLCFMVLSGFVIAHLIVTKREPYGLYIVRRWLRLFPLLAVCLSAVLAIWVLAPATFPHVTNRRESLDIYLVLSFLMAQGLVPDQALWGSATGILSVAWSTSVEWQFYIVAPLLIWPVMSKRYWLLAPMLVLSWLIAQPAYTIGGTRLTWGPGGFLPMTIVYFIIGISAYAAFLHFPTIVKLATPFALRPLVWLGEVSYSVYLIHIIVLHSCRVFVVEPLFARSDSQFFPVLLLLTIVGTLIVAQLAYRVVETPTINFGRRLVQSLSSRSTNFRHAESPVHSGDRL